MRNDLRERRAQRGWSQGDLAERLGVSRQTVNAIETGKYDPSLELAFGTPSGWLAAGKSVAVRESPTSFGPLSYEIDAGYGQITATVEVPARRPPLTMKLRLRVPAGHRVLGVRVDGKRRPFDRKTATVDLSGLRGTLSIIAEVR